MTMSFLRREHHVDRQFMRQIRRSPLSSTAIVRLITVVIGAVMLFAALRFIAVMPDVMPGNAAGILMLVTIGTILLLGAIWIGN